MPKEMTGKGRQLAEVLDRVPLRALEAAMTRRPELGGALLDVTRRAEFRKAQRRQLEVEADVTERWLMEDECDRARRARARLMVGLHDEGWGVREICAGLGRKRQTVEAVLRRAKRLPERVG